MRMQRQKNTQSFSRNAFTLVELLVVILILSLLASTIAVTLKGPVSNARLQLAIDQWSSIDTNVRESCRKLRREAVLHFDCPKNTLTVEYPQEGTSRQMWTIYGMKSIRTTQGFNPLRDIHVDRFGRTETYLIQFDSGKRTKWHLCAGISGQTVELADEKQVEQFFQSFAIGNDAY